MIRIDKNKENLQINNIARIKTIISYDNTKNIINPKLNSFNNFIHKTEEHEQYLSPIKENQNINTHGKVSTFLSDFKNQTFLYPRKNLSNFRK